MPEAAVPQPVLPSFLSGEQAGPMHLCAADESFLKLIRIDSLRVIFSLFHAVS